MRTRALWRFDEVQNAIRPVDALGAVSDLEFVPPFPMTAIAMNQSVGWANWLAGYLFEEPASPFVPIFGAANLNVGPVSFRQPGARRGAYSVLFDASTDTSALASNGTYDVTAPEDVGFAWVKRQSLISAGVTRLFVKAQFVGGTPFYHVYNTSTQVIAELGDGVDLIAPGTGGHFFDDWTAGMLVLERGTNKARIAVRSLTTGAQFVSPEINAAAIGTLANTGVFTIGGDLSAAFNLDALYIAKGVGACNGLSANLATAIANFGNSILSRAALVDAAAGRGRSFVALSRHGFEGADVVSGSTLLTRDASVQAIVRWDLQEQGGAMQWTLTKTGGTNGVWDAGASSIQSIAGDGSVEFVVATGSNMALGFSVDDVSRLETDIEYGWQVSSAGSIFVREGGGTPFAVGGPGAYVVGDIFRVERTGTTVRYYINGILRYTSIVPSAGALIVDSAFFDTNASISNVRLVDSGARKSITWQTIVNLTTTPTENIAGALYARGKATGASEYLNAGVELRVANAALNIGELRWLWQDTGGTLLRQDGGYFEAPDGSYIMLTATRRWVSSTKVILRYFLGDRMLAEVESLNGSIGGGTTGTTTIGARFDGTKYLDFFDGVIDELRVVDYELAPEEIAATWARITKFQPRGYELLKQMHPPGFPISGDPSSRVQRETNMWGQALGYAAAQAENLRNLLPSRAYGEALEQWEDTMKVSPKPLDDLDTRRARVVGRLRQRAGVSIPGVREAVKGLINTVPSNLEIIGFSQEIVEQYDRQSVWSTGAGASIQKTGGVDGAGDAGIASVETIDGDGFVEVVATETNKARAFGLNATDVSVSIADIDYAMYLRADAAIEILENGVSRGVPSAYATGDVLRVRRRGTTVTYERNGTLLYTSGVTSAGGLRFDTAFSNSNATLSGIRFVSIENTSHREIGITALGATNVTVTPAHYTPFRDGVIVKSASGGAWNGGASSVESIAGDGYIETTADVTTNNRIIGFSDVDTNQDFATIDYAIHMSTAAALGVFENGVSKFAGAYAANDVLRVERVGTTVYYKKNGVIFYTSLAPSSGPLIIDSSLFEVGAALRAIKLSDAGTRRSITWTSTVNVQAYADATRVQGANAEDLQFTGFTQIGRAATTAIASAPQFATAVDAQVAEGYGAHLLTKIEPIALPNRAEVGIAFWDRARNHAFLFGLRNDAGTFRIVTERFVSGASLGAVNRAVTALQAHWMHLFVEAPSSIAAGPISNTTWNLTAAWSTTGAKSGYTSYAGIAHTARFQWAALYLRSFGGTLSGATDAFFDETKLYTPYGDRSLRFYAFRSPALSGTPDVLGAHAVIQGLKHAHTDATIITSKELIADTDGHWFTRGPAGGF